MRECKRHRGKSLGRGVHDNHRVLFPRRAGRLVANAAPKIDDFLAAMIDAARGAELSSSGEVFEESVAHGVKACADVTVNQSWSANFHGRLSPVAGLRIAA